MADEETPTPPRPQNDSAGHHRMAVQSDPTTSLGVYANMMMVSHRKGEFVLDFLFVPPQQSPMTQPSATLRTRVITTPEHAKRIVRALHDNIHRYEASYGTISEATDLPTRIH